MKFRLLLFLCLLSYIGCSRQEVVTNTEGQATTMDELDVETFDWSPNSKALLHKQVAPKHARLDPVGVLVSQPSGDTIVVTPMPSGEFLWEGSLDPNLEYTLFVDHQICRDTLMLTVTSEGGFELVPLANQGVENDL